ncbi:arsenate reductase family protein [Sediminibacter sp. Hel_I_10]|uniref:arsenate reductase family protein n=1 Tax=Sediminibacter sp. Hel_I_10 TaxID=1392490 RepID=UPI00047B8D17|nr:ArsC/Spx/MgsR family protein [Sediminibacter sp. Hel_I_10]
MKKIYHLSTCTTCKRIIKELNLNDDVALQDIKSNPITEVQLDELKTMAGSYEALFSKRAQLYKSKGLKDKVLTEADFKNYVLEHYTFLKRPVMLFDDQIFIGNSAKTVADAKAYLSAHD